MNTFGDKFSFTSFGESHSAAIGGVLDGVPAGLPIDLNAILDALNRRAGRTTSAFTSPRALRETDEVEWLSGVINAPNLITLGTPIAFIIRNRDHRPEDYEILKHSFRPAHADLTYEVKYGIRDWRGGGRASARETAGRVVAGQIVQQLLAKQGITIRAEVVQVGVETNPDLFVQEITRYVKQGDSIGGIVRCEVTGLPIGLGEPIFDKLQAHLAYAMLSINACKGFDYGSGFAGVTEPGAIANEHSGGLLGGITDGTTLSFRCVFKPTPSTPKVFAKMAEENKDIAHVVNRSDACIAMRTPPIIEAMTALVLANFALTSESLFSFHLSAFTFPK